MRLLAALTAGAFAYLLVGAATGNLPRLRLASLRPARGGVSRHQTWLIQAGADLTPRQFVLGSVGAGAATFLLVVLVTGTPAVAIVPGIVMGFVPRAYYARRRAARLGEVQAAWPDGLRDILASISAGLSLNQALEALARGGPQPLQDAFERYPQLSRMLGVVPALEVIKEELADPTSDRVIEVLILAHERGGHILSEILTDLAAATTKDMRTQEEIATATLEQKINARAVFVLPWLVLMVLTLRPGPFREFYRSTAGVIVVVIGAIMSLFGIWLAGRLSRDQDEDRVFGGAARPGRQGGAP